MSWSLSNKLNRSKESKESKDFKQPRTTILGDKNFTIPLKSSQISLLNKPRYDYDDIADISYINYDNDNILNDDKQLFKNLDVPSSPWSYRYPFKRPSVLPDFKDVPQVVEPFLQHSLYYYDIHNEISAYTFYDIVIDKMFNNNDPRNLQYMLNLYFSTHEQHNYNTVDSYMVLRHELMILTVIIAFLVDNYDPSITNIKDYIDNPFTITTNNSNIDNDFSLSLKNLRYMQSGYINILSQDIYQEYYKDDDNFGKYLDLLSGNFIDGIIVVTNTNVGINSKDLSLSIKLLKFDVNTFRIGDVVINILDKFAIVRLLGIINNRNNIYTKFIEDTL